MEPCWTQCARSLGIWKDRKDNQKTEKIKLSSEPTEKRKKQKEKKRELLAEGREDFFFCIFQSQRHI